MADPLEAMGTWLGSRDWGAAGQFANRALGGPMALWAEEPPPLALAGPSPAEVPSGPTTPDVGPQLQSVEPTGGLAALAAGGYQPPAMPVNPYAAQLASMTPAQLQAASISRSGSGSVSRLGGKPLPGLQQAYDRLAQQQQVAAMSAGEAQSKGALERAGAMRVSQAAQEHRQAAFEADIAKERARAEKYDSQAAGMRAQIAEMKVDPENYWSSRTTGEKFGIALGVALSQFGMILAKQQGPNPVLQMFERAIDRDIDAQKTNINKAKGDLADVKGALGDVYRKMGDMRSAENQTKILMMESLKSKLDIIGSTTQSEVYKAAALQQSATVGERLLQLKNQAWQSERPRITSGGSTSTPSQLQAVGMASKIWEAGQGGKPGTGEKLPKTEMDKVIAAQESNDREQQYVRELMKYKSKKSGASGKIGETIAKATGGYFGEEAGAVSGMRDRVIAMQVKALSGVTARPDEVAKEVMNYPGWGDPPALIAAKLARQAEQRVNSLKAILQVHPNSPQADKVYHVLLLTQAQMKRYAAAAKLSGM